MVHPLCVCNTAGDTECRCGKTTYLFSVDNQQNDGNSATEQSQQNPWYRRQFNGSFQQETIEKNTVIEIKVEKDHNHDQKNVAIDSSSNKMENKLYANSYQLLSNIQDRESESTSICDSKDYIPPIKKDDPNSNCDNKSENESYSSDSSDPYADHDNSKSIPSFKSTKHEETQSHSQTSNTTKSNENIHNLVQSNESGHKETGLTHNKNQQTNAKSSMANMMDELAKANLREPIQQDKAESSSEKSTGSESMDIEESVCKKFRSKEKPRKSKQQKKEKRQRKEDKISKETNLTPNEKTIEFEEPAGLKYTDTENDGWKIVGSKGKTRTIETGLPKTEKEVEEVTVQFNVFAPPVFEINLDEWEFGIISSNKKFKKSQMYVLKAEVLNNGGYLVSGQLKMPKHFEYKYILRNKSEKAYLIEFSGKFKNRSFTTNPYSKVSVVHKYDGIMLPPDQESKNVFQTVKKFANQIFGGNYYDKKFLKEHEDETIKAMLYEVHVDSGRKFDTFESCSNYLENVLDGLEKVLNCSRDSLKTKLYRFLLEILLSESEQNTRFAFSIAIISHIFKNSYSYYATYVPNFLENENANSNALLDFLNIDETDKIMSFFNGPKKCGPYIYGFREALNYLISRNPRSLYLLELVIQIEYSSTEDEKDNHSFYSNVTNVDRWKQFITSNNFDFNWSHTKILQKIHKPSKLLLLICFKGLFHHNAISVDDTFLFPTDIILAYLIHSISLNHYHYYHRDYLTTKNSERLVAILEKSISQTILSENDESNKDHLECLFELTGLLTQDTSKLHSFICYCRNSSNLVYLLLVKLNVWCAFKKKELPLCKTATTTNTDKVNEVPNEVFKDAMCSYLPGLLQNFLNDKISINSDYGYIIHVWSILLDIRDLTLESLVIFKRIDEAIMNQLNSQKIANLFAIIKYFADHADNNINDIKTFTIDAIKSNIDKMTETEINEMASMQNSAFNELAKDVLHQKWPKDESEVSIFKFIFDCNLFLKVFFFMESSIKSTLTDDYQEKEAQMISLIDATLESLYEGTIKISLVKLLERNKDMLKDVLLIFSNRLSFKYSDTETSIDLVFKCRLAEIQNIAEFYKLMNEFSRNVLKNTIGYDKVDIAKFEGSLKMYSEDIELNNLIYPLKSNEIVTNGTFDEKIFNSRIKLFDEIDPKDLPFIQSFIKLFTDNSILRNLLNESTKKEIFLLNARPIKNQQIPIEVYIQSMKLAQEEYSELSKQAADGKLSFKKFEEITKNQKDWQENFGKLMNFAKMSDKLIKQRFEQIEVYNKLDNINKIIEILLELKTKNELTGNFSVLQDMLKSLSVNDYHNKCFNQIDQETMGIYRRLEKLSSNQLYKCLQSFNKNYFFISWLRKELADLRALKLLCEIATESENEGALEVVRVQSLSMVGTAYSPLIFNLKKDASYEQLIHQVDLVNQNLEKNPHLSEKIDAIAKEKSWLEEIKDAKGNSELNSLKQAQKINDLGVYDFGLEPDFCQEEICLNDIIRLRLPKTKETENTERQYKFSQLSDLHDKLTLVVGRNKEHQDLIQYFENIFEGLITMGHTYIDLIKTGNVLFKNWTATIYCEPNSKYTMRVNFGVKCENQNIFGVRELELKTIESINKTIKFLQNSYDEWLNHINSKREEFPSLNVFQINQIVMLRTDLAKFIGDTETAKRLDKSDYKNMFDLLFSVNQKMSLELLEAANKSAFGEIQKNFVEETVSLEENSDEGQSDVCKQLEELGFTKLMINKAFKELESEDLDELTEYCMRLDMEEEIPEVRSNNLQNFEEIKSEFIMNTPDAYEDRSQESLEFKYKDLWQKFVNYLDYNFESFISLKHLGLVVDYLQHKSELIINRQKPPYLDIGVPNLIVCPQDEIIKRTLNIYRLSPTEPMPGNDEVIYCTPNTTYEQLELFWKRCLLNNSKNDQNKIYCLMNVQDLSYDHAVKAEIMFEKMLSTENVRKDFRLCILCSSEHEDKSVFATAFNRHKKNIPLENDLDSELIAYFSQHFKLNEEENSLSSIDKDGLNVRVVTSDRSSVGKSLYIKRQIEKAKTKIDSEIQSHCISIKKQVLPFESIFKELKSFDNIVITRDYGAEKMMPRIFHLDISYEVWHDVDFFLFNLLCLSTIQSNNGNMFRRSFDDVYLIEIMSPYFQSKNSNTSKPLHSMLTILPSMRCLNPVETLDILEQKSKIPDNICPILFDQGILTSNTIQRPCQYLKAAGEDQNLEALHYTNAHQLDASVCLNLLLTHLENVSPSWSEIVHFASFLNAQLVDCENSIFCNTTLTGDLLPGFKRFVIKFMIQMSHDFALPSLKISDVSALKMNMNNQAEFKIDQLKMRRKWENDPHPYLFFNPDGQTFTFFGFYVDRNTGHLMEPNTNKRLFDNLAINKALMQGIELQDANLLKENIENMTKRQKIFKMLRVMGVRWMNNDIDLIQDPDPSYELTMDNLLKMIAIHMRLRANIPVIIMGETGCGKTRLCKYMCDLHIDPNRTKEKLTNMYLVKVHGGTTSEDIVAHVKKAETLARHNSRISPGIYTILFFDEANSTEAIGIIKEIMCDNRINGVSLEQNTGLKIIAACNPYKKHSQEIINSFEKSGLGFYVDIEETKEKLGDVPMRHLVYRVQPLPASMLPLIWDFGQLNDHVEELYINQIVHKKFKENNLNKYHLDLIVELLAKSQQFMRRQNNECSFVSLRNVQRTLLVIQWFLANGEEIFQQMIKHRERTINNGMEIESDDAEYLSTVESDTDSDNEPEPIEDLTESKLIKSIILSLNICYHVGLQSEASREKFRENVIPVFKNRSITSDYMAKEIDSCYEVFLDEIQVPNAIARNQALKENVFMMLFCIELKIPLFLIGKPGSSKSLAKTLIAQRMQGLDRSNSAILKKFKEASLITFQCSPLSTSEMILKTFRHCAKYQLERKNDLERYTSVVVLDEIGLAEASASMPLKTLHPLLEEGVYFDEEEKNKVLTKAMKNKSQTDIDDNKDWLKVGFIGISNWVLDPAKMNRGIFVNRNSPSLDELKDTFEGICKKDTEILQLMRQKKLINSLSQAYLKICESARQTREFFGLRDFYCLIKMIYWHIRNKLQESGISGSLEWSFLQKAIRRNFGGLIGIDPVTVFLEQFRRDKIDLDFNALTAQVNVIEMIKEALMKKTTEDENRYLLLLSPDENALDLINTYIFNEFEHIKNVNDTNNNLKVIFGSSFPNDQKYSQICKKIHQIKLCMELGKTVILLNLENLYESLYDLLNQFYYKFSEVEKFVDLGLGTQRVKCLVHNNFRLIVIADKASVYNPKKYPIPLVNRLEKHLFSVDSILDDRMKRIVSQLKEWCLELAKLSEKYAGQTNTKIGHKLKPSDIFIGFTEDSIPTLVFKMCRANAKTNLDDDVIEKTKNCLIQCATSDGIIRLLIKNNFTYIDNEIINSKEIVDAYFKGQFHDNFKQFFTQIIEEPDSSDFVQITTHSRLLSKNDVDALKTDTVNIRQVSLIAFYTQQELIQVLVDFYHPQGQDVAPNQVLVIQCDCAHLYENRINCARYTIIDEYSKYRLEKGNDSDAYEDQSSNSIRFKVILIVQIPKIAGGCIAGFQTGKWFCYHIDDLMDSLSIGNLLEYKDKSLSCLFTEAFDKNANYFTTFMNILRSIIYVSCSKVNGVQDRSIQRIEILICLLKADVNVRFCRSLLGHIARLQADRESVLSSEEVAKTWLFKDAAKLTNVIKYGTLKSSCINYIEHRLGHLFSGIIAFLDSNNNLDLLIQPGKPWIGRFWLEVFDDETLVDFNYSKMYLQTNNLSEKNDFSCMISTRRFKLKLPFSWMMKRWLDQLILIKVREVEIYPNTDQALPEELNQTAKNLIEQLKHVFSESHFFKKLHQIIGQISTDDQEIQTDFNNYYVNDLLILTFKDTIINQNHLNLIKKRFSGYCKARYSVLYTDLNSLVVYHLALESIKQELELFAKFAHVNSKLVEQILKSDNMNVNVCSQAAKIVCHQLSKTNPEMKRGEWEKWFKDVKMNSLLVETYLGLCPTDQNNNVVGDCGIYEKISVEFKSLWQKVNLVKMFIEHLCHIDKFLYARCITLWNYLDASLDLKSFEYFEKLLKFVRSISGSMSKKYLIECKGCKIKDSSFQIYSSNCPSNCYLCGECISDIKSDKKCHGCAETLRNPKFEKVPASKELITFKKGLNCFFMDIVNNICFGDKHQLPDDQVIETIIENLMPRTRSACTNSNIIFLDFDLNKSIKTTLFQLLLNYRENKVQIHLNKILSKSKDFLQEKYREEDLSELKIMFINSIENNFYSKQALVQSNSRIDVDVDLGTRFLDDLLYSENKTKFSKQLDELETIAKIKFVLSTLAKLFADSQINENQTHLKFVKKTELFINNCHSKWPRFFLIKYVFRKYGQSVLMESLKSDIYHWILPEELIKQSQKDLQDSFVICGTNYLEVRRSLEDAFILGNFNKLSFNQIPKNELNILYTLAIFKRFTLSDIKFENHEDKCKKLLDILNKKFKNQEITLYEDLIFKKNLPTHFTNDANKLTVAMLVVHVNAVLVNSQHDILKPFRDILERPEEFSKSYLPSIPHDEDFEILQIYKNINKEASKFYTCKNGHYYAIGDCTRPAFTGLCPTCKTPIGGAGYKLVEGNQDAKGLEEKVQYGYCIPVESQRNTNIESIRNMGLLNTAIMRLILNITLYIASLHSDKVSQLFQKKDRSKDMKQFFADQVMRDVKVVANCLQHSPEESLLLIHFILSQINTIPNVKKVDATLKSKEARIKYETLFCTKLIDQIVGNNFEKIVKNMTNVLTEDTKNASSNQLFRIAYDLLSPEDVNESEEGSFNNKKYWLFRRQITVENMINYFSTKLTTDKKFTILNEFFKRIHELKALKYLPSIAKMIQALHTTVNRQIDRQHAKSVKLEDILINNKVFDTTNTIIRTGVRNFFKTWSIIKSSMCLEFRLDSSESILNNTECENVPLSYLLPSTFSDGRYIYSMVFYLISLQNDFMEFFEKNRDNLDWTTVGSDGEEPVELESITVNDCISFTVDKDLLQVVYMNTNYSYETKEINLEYDFDKIQKTIVNRFLENKSRIQATIPLIEYSDDINDISRFESLNQKVKQVELDYLAKDKISSFYKQPNELNDIIRIIHIVIDFVVSSGCSPDMKIIHYAVNVLKMMNIEESKISRQINDLEVTYLKSLWNLLSFQRVLLLTQHGQDPFSQLDEKFKSNIELDDEPILMDRICAVSRTKNLTNLFHILNLVYKLIAFKLTLEADTLDYLEMEISDVLETLTEEFCGSIEDKIDLSGFNLEQVKVKNVFHLWKVISKLYFQLKNI